MRGKLVGAGNVLVAVAVTACGAELESTNPQNENPTMPASDAARPLAGTVGVFLFHRQTAEGVSFETALAASFEASGSPSALTCTEDTDGACVRKICQWEHGTGGAVPTYASAGPITARAGERTLTVMPQDANVYGATFEHGQFWELGQPIHVEAAGVDSEVPWFKTQVMPPEFTNITAPRPSADSSILIDRAERFLTTWGEASSGDMLAILKYRDNFEQGSITCRFPVQEEGAVFSTELLQDFNASNAPMRLTMGIAQSTIVPSGDWNVEVIAYTSATGPDGGDASFPAQFID
jgi:hypothetical protein